MHAQLLASYGVHAGPAYPTYRYWRIYVTAVGSGAYLAIQEIELRGTPGGADLTSPSTPSSQSSYFAPDNAVAQKAVDNNFVTPTTGCFITDGSAFPQWGWWDLGTPKGVAEIGIWPQASGTASARGPKDFEIQGSNDASSWTTVEALTGITGWAAGVSKTFALA